MPTAVESYHEKYQELEAARISLRNIEGKINTVARLLTQHFDKCYARGKSVPQIIEDRGAELDLWGWPSAGEIEAILKCCHDALQEAVKAWESLSPTERVGLRYP